MTADTTLPIGIVGAGIAGLSFAISLQKQRIKSIIFEKDKGFHCRHQGYGLTLQQGGKAFNKLDLLHQIQSKCVLSNCHYIFNNCGELILGWGSFQSLDDNSKWDSKYICHIARQDLRECFINELDPEFVTIRWESEFESYLDTDDSVLVKLKNLEPPIPLRMLAGCDGIYSQVRKSLIPNSSLIFLNTFVMLGIVKSSPTFHHRVIQMSNGHARIFCMPFNKDEVMWQLSFPNESTARVDKAELKQLAINKCFDFHSTILNIIQETPDHNITGYPVFDRETLENSDFPTNSKITLLGDAAHPMSPFKGQGANQALLDALSLTEFILKFDKMEVAIAEYQQRMITRTKSKVSGSREAIALLHNEAFVNTEYQLTRKHFANIDKHLAMYSSIKDKEIGIWNIEKIDTELESELAKLA